MASDRVPVPCGKCTLCCSAPVLLHPEHGDNLDALQWHEHHEYGPNGGTFAMLNKKDDGTCVYLTKAGCSIWDRAPWECRQFDCREYFSKFTQPERHKRIKAFPLNRDIFEAGKSRLTRR